MLRNRSEAASDQCASSTAMSRGECSARFAVNQYRPCSTAKDGSTEGETSAASGARARRWPARPGGCAREQGVALGALARRQRRLEQLPDDAERELALELGPTRGQHGEALPLGLAGIARISADLPIPAGPSTSRSPPAPLPAALSTSAASGVPRPAEQGSHARSRNHSQVHLYLLAAPALASGHGRQGRRHRGLRRVPADPCPDRRRDRRRAAEMEAFDPATARLRPSTCTRARTSTSRCSTARCGPSWTVLHRGRRRHVYSAGDSFDGPANTPHQMAAEDPRACAGSCAVPAHGRVLRAPLRRRATTSTSSRRSPRSSAHVAMVGSHGAHGLRTPGLLRRQWLPGTRTTVRFDPPSGGIPNGSLSPCTTSVGTVTASARPGATSPVVRRVHREREAQHRHAPSRPPCGRRRARRSVRPDQRQAREPSAAGARPPPSTRRRAGRGSLAAPPATR